MDKELLKSGLAKVSALVYRSSYTRLNREEEIALSAAIKVTGANCEAAGLFASDATFVCERAEMHLAALTAIPPRELVGIPVLVKDCERLLKRL